MERAYSGLIIGQESDRARNSVISLGVRLAELVLKDNETDMKSIAEQLLNVQARPYKMDIVGRDTLDYGYSELAKCGRGKIN